MKSLGVAVLALPLVACGAGGNASTASNATSAAETTSTAATNGSTSDGDATTEGADTTGGDMVDPTPILEREPAPTHACMETRSMTQAAGATFGRTEGLVATGGDYFALRSAETLTIAGLTLDGTIYDEVVLEPEAFASRNATAVVLDADIASVWTYAGASGSVLRYAVVDDAAGTVVAAKDLPDLAAAYVSVAALVPTDSSGLALFYGESDDGGATSLRLVHLDAAGEVTDGPVDVAEIGATFGTISASAAVASDGGYAVTYVTGELGQGEVSFVVLDADGTPRFAPRRISKPAGDGWSAEFGAVPRNNLLRVGDRYWVAFTEGWADNVAMQGTIVVRLAIVDEQGDAEGHLLQAPVEGKNNLWPSLVAFDDRVGVMWTSGTIIWICGGCIADNDLHFVLLDPDAVVPASDVVTHLHETSGIVAPLAARVDANILTAASLDLHALTLPASGALRCEPS